MATPQIDAKTGQFIQPSSDTSGGTDAHSIFANNLTQMLKDAQKVSTTGNANLEAQKSGLEVGQAGLSAVSENNPLAFLYNMAPNSAKAGMYDNTSRMFEPGIASIEGQ